MNASFLFVFYTFIGIIKSPFSSLWTRLDRLESVGASVTGRRISQWGWKDDLRMEVRTMSGKTPLAESNDQVKDFGLLEVSNFWCCGSKPKIEQKVGWSWMGAVYVFGFGCQVVCWITDQFPREIIWAWGDLEKRPLFENWVPPSHGLASLSLLKVQ